MYFKVLFMDNEKELSVKAIQDIRAIMERSARFITLSGWSGVWAGCVGLAGAFIAYTWLKDVPETYSNAYPSAPAGILAIGEYGEVTFKFIILALIVLLVAVAGGYYFTWKKTKASGQKLWNSASKRMVAHMAIPLVAGALFSLLFLNNGHELYVAPTCLVFYGLALINGSKYTISDIRYLGFSELGLGFINMALPGCGLICWAIGFGLLHILYGIIMWNKYDNTRARG